MYRPATPISNQITSHHIKVLESKRRKRHDEEGKGDDDNDMELKLDQKVEVRTSFVIDTTLPTSPLDVPWTHYLTPLIHSFNTSTGEVPRSGEILPWGNCESTV